MASKMAEEIFIGGSERGVVCLGEPSGVLRTQKVSVNFCRDIVSAVPLVATDVLAVVIAWVACRSVLMLITGNAIAPGYSALIGTGILYPMLLYTQGLYPGLLIRPAEEVERVYTSAVLASLGFLVASIIFRGYEIYHVPERLLNFVLLFACGVLGRITVRELLSNVQWWKQEVSIVGAKPDCNIVKRWLENNGQLGVTAQRKSRLSSGNVILASMGNRDDANILRHRNIWHVEYFGNQPHVTRFQKNYLLSPIHMLSKRLFDLTVIVLAAPLVVPVFLLLSMMVKLTSSGPIFYSQCRTGRNGKPFRAWKFRSMVPNADEVLKEHLAKDASLQREWEKDHKLKRDPRVTAVGRLMRKTSLDELPQLFNVLAGEMSLVGPRPIVDQEIGKYADRYICYQSVAPGITGLWQVNGRNNTTYEERTAFDEDYACNWSVWFDIYILFRTVKTVLRCEGAY